MEKSPHLPVSPPKKGGGGKKYGSRKTEMIKRIFMGKMINECLGSVVLILLEKYWAE